MTHINRSFKTILLLILIFYSNSATITVTPQVTTINSVTSYQWSISGLTAAPANTTIIMQFPANCIFSSSTVQNSDGTLYNGGANITFSGTIVTVRLINGHQSNTSFFFRVTNVKNPFWQVTDLAIFYHGTSSSSFAIVYNKGPIRNCFLSFLGVTDQTSSTAFIDLQTTNPINRNNTVFIIQYGSYTQFRSSLISNINLNCSYSLDGGTTYSAEVLGRITSSTYLNCQFPNLNLLQNAVVKLKLTNARNPPFKNNYIASTFKVQTSDGSKFYDTASSCNLGDVAVQTYSALFTQSSKTVNTNYNSPIVQTIQQITKNFRQNDSILIQHDGITFGSLGSFILFTRITTGNALRFDFQSGTGITNILTKNTLAVSNSQTDRIRISMSNFVMQIPPSATLTNLTFRFFRAATSPLPADAALQYLNIFATLQPKAATFPTSGSLNVVPSTSVIGDPTNYRFTLRLGNPLSASCKILLYLPLGLNISQNSNSYPTCSLQSTAVSPQVLCSVFDLPNNIIQVNINSTGLAAQTINITIGNLTNPVNPQRPYSFGAKTYYNQSDMTSQTEVGTDLTTIYYITRNMLVNTSNTIYTVSQNPAALILYYFPGVPIPANLFMVFNFTSNLANIKYKNISINGVSATFVVTNSTALLFNMTINTDIAANSNVTITFEFQAPNNQSIYQAVDITVGTFTKPYEKTSTLISINVGNPASQIFTFTPLTQLTGVKTSYTLKFYTNVPHPRTFNLSIKFPSDVTIDALNARCEPVSVCTSRVFDRSVGTDQQIYVNITASTTSSIYTISIGNITNSRQIGASGIFTFTTLTSTGNRILAGTTTVSISQPNAITGTSFDKSKSYYRSNSEPVTITGTYTNQLRAGDFIRVFFDYRTYVVASTGITEVKCSDGNNCTYDGVLSTNFSTVVIIQPLSLVSPIRFTIGGLNSSSTTYPSQQFQVVIKSYSSLDRQMDEGKLTYNLSCISNSALISKNCQKCNQVTNVCTSCYTGFYLLNNNTCVTDCASSSTYQTFPGSNQCVACINNCRTCISNVTCLTCLDRSFYLYQNSSCSIGCNTAAGFYTSTPSNGQQMCLTCWSPGCMKCTDGGSSSCTDCGSNFLQNGKCIANCNALTSYVNNATGQCLPCNIACQGCTGSTNTQCIKCRTGFYNISGICSNQCPSGAVPLSNGTCGCEGNCLTCQLYSTRCTACRDISSKLHNYQCLSICPNSTYQSANKCVDCNQGCQQCSITACNKCLPGYNVYETRCFTQCNNVGQRFAAVNGMCIQCPVGCDLCDQNLTCSVCLANYTLVDQKTCQRTCQIFNNCQKVNPVPDKIIPVPGFITAGVWLLILVCLKFFFIQKMYLPYSYIFLSCVIEYILIIALIAKTDTQIKTLIAESAARLLQTITSQEGPQPHQYAVLGLLACSFALNYIQNFVYLFLFCKYLRKYIPDRQIDKISNYLVLTVGILTNFRFSLMAYSKMFPKPNITVQNQSKLTPIHYMCIASIFTSILPIVAAGMLIYNQYALTDLFMLGIDLLIIVILSLMFTIWMVSVDKPAEYFQSTKKYSKQQINQTQEAMFVNQKDDVKQNTSHYKLRESSSNIENSIIQVEDIKQQIQIQNNNPIIQRSERNQTKLSKLNKSDNQNEPLPQIPIRTTQINLQAVKIKTKDSDRQQGAVKNQYQSQDDQSLQEQERKRNIRNSSNFTEQKTQRNKNRSTLQQNKGLPGKKVLISQQEPQVKKKVGYQHPQYNQKGIKNRSRQSPKNFGKERSSIKKQKPDQLNLKIHNVSKATNKGVQFNQSQEFEQLELSQPSLKPAQSQVVPREKKVTKPITQRSSGILPITMKKTDSFGLFQSQKAASQVDQVDLESIIQTKMIDKTKQKNKTTTQKNNEVQHQEISPSWFNQQNQRFDFEESSDM